MSVSVQWERPSPKQELFLSDTHRHVAYGGARGGGKSWAVRYKARLLALQYPGIRLLIVRRTYRELTNNHIEPLKGMLQGLARYNATEKVFKFYNGSTIWFGYCDSDADLGQYQGAEYDVIFLDEATNLQEDWIRKINLAVRSGSNEYPKRTYYTCNPGGVSHSYIKRLFIERRYEGSERPEDYSFTQALVTDNYALMEKQPEYMAELENLPDKLRKAWLHGSWDIFEGQFFEDFIPNPPAETAKELGLDVETLRQRHQWCHVIPPFEIPRGWTLSRSYDFGYAKPFSVGYWAVDYDGNLYRIAELYGCTATPNEGVKWTPEQQFAEMVRFESEHPLLRGRQFSDSVADPAIWDASRGESIAETASRYGIYFSPGDHKRIPGWMQVHYRLCFDDNGYSRMYIFDTCKAFIRTIPLMLFSETHPEDLDTSLEDHCADEVRYMCMSRPIKPLLRKEPQQLYYDPLDQFGGDKRR